MIGMKMSSKIYSILGMLAVLSIGIVVLSIVKLGDIKDQVDNMAQLTAPMVDRAGSLNTAVLLAVRAQKNVVLAKTDEESKQFADVMNTVEKQVEDERKALGELVEKSNNADLKTLLSQYDAAWEKRSRSTTRSNRCRSKTRITRRLYFIRMTRTKHGRRSMPWSGS